jgi:hypothetical protein
MQNLTRMINYLDYQMGIIYNLALRVLVFSVQAQDHHIWKIEGHLQWEARLLSSE